ncbi:putative phage terminase large subunit-like protein [Paraburkholderia sp. HC6.4b]|uniref:phage terminase large subunit n=1 Tax=unclassified Paraburkholderia TaxID=2615204 RepID=UPI001607A8B1|nr:MULTISPECIES: phage terminase large subunit [unclassified Paraburkholderia]MBB5411919.1 putative phage terminase large subunit-like protein [Paraburkholderia sp. HC6.4b]MBB5450231.1 putative phage terminase large subunit-like protein [Paraburkholderia sp. Kb1A]
MSDLTWESLTPLERGVLRVESEASLLMFARGFFRFMDGGKFAVNWHHHLLCDELENVESENVTRLFINIPPGGSKSHLASICFPARGYARNRKARFMQATSGDELVQANSTRTRDLVGSQEFQAMWPMKFSSDTNSKKSWFVVDERGIKKGEFRAAALGGQTLGFRAGRLDSGYQGSAILDDPNKPSDMLSDIRREKSNASAQYVIDTRLARSDTPVVVIQQRLHVDDFTGNFLAGKTLKTDLPWLKVWTSRGTAGDIRQIIVPALIDDEYVHSLPKKYRDLVNPKRQERDDKGRFSYWAAKDTLSKLLELEARNDYVFKSQFGQRPRAFGGTIFRQEYLHYYDQYNPPPFEYIFLTADTAQKKGRRNDYSIVCCWGVYRGCLYLIDAIKGKFEAPELEEKFIEFALRCNSVEGMPNVRAAYVEDKSSGTGLIQTVRTSLPFPVLPVSRGSGDSKIERYNDTTPHMAANRVLFPMDHPLLTEFVSELMDITSNDTHAHDDFADNLADAVRIGLRGNVAMPPEKSKVYPAVGIATPDYAT